MQNKKYTVAIKVSKPADAVFKDIIALSKWWPEEFEGDSLQLNSGFVFKTGEGHYSRNKVTEFVPGKKIVWITTESRRNLDNFDWTGTKMIFELTPEADMSLLKFTYDGPVLENELERLAQVCDLVIKENLYNLIESFTATIEVAKSPESVFTSITRDVGKWWGGKDLEGDSEKLNDEFIINHPGAHYSIQKLIEVVPEKRIVWLVTESTLDWLKKDQHEWKNTRMIFEIAPKADKTVLHFTHEGLVPDKECYEMCAKGWTMVIKDWLFRFISEDRPHF